MTQAKKVRPVDVLLVEDSPHDVELTTEALKDSKLEVNLQVVSDGEQALQYLKKQPPYEDVVRPDVVLLDLNLPKVKGMDVLKEIRSDEALKSMPVVVLTTSSDEEDVLRAYEYKANCYVTKPLGFDEFAKVVHSISEFWFTIVRLPSR